MRFEFSIRKGAKEQKLLGIKQTHYCIATLHIIYNSSNLNPEYAAFISSRI